MSNQQQQMADDFEARVAEIRARAEARPLLSFGGVDQPENGPVARQRVQACFADRWRLLAFVEAALPLLRDAAELGDRFERIVDGESIYIGDGADLARRIRALLAGTAGAADEGSES